MSFLGNLFGHHKKEQEAPQHEQPKHDEPQQAHAAEAEHKPEQKYKFQILTDEQAHFTDVSYFTQLKVGHAWVRMIAPDQSVSSWGFWPAEGHKVNPLMPWKSIPGQVRSPDATHSPTGMHTWEIDPQAAQKMEKAAHNRMGSPGQYNLFSRNCVNFAHDMCDAAGVAAPSMSTLGIANPNALQAGIEALNKRQGEDAMERPLPDSKFGMPNS